MKYEVFAAGVMLAGMMVAGPAAAQPNRSADPISGTISLDAGFTPDPRVINVRAGGAERAQSVSGSCAGFISTRPDIRLNYDAGSFPLIISVQANADTTLVVNGPDGSWYCNDDGGEGFNPSVRFNNPQSGAYEIWIGTYNSGSTQPARLYISEAGSR
jgi:hypothetical protein